MTDQTPNTMSIAENTNGGKAVSVSQNSGSFRDPRGKVFHYDDRIFRTVMPSGVSDYEYVNASGLLNELNSKDMVIDGKEVDPSLIGNAANGAIYLLEHPPLPFISYPYEWTFLALKEAALLHLDIQVIALKFGVSLSDASAYNIQFIGSKPIFIDYLSFRKYQEGEFWIAHRQFCEQFLNPLLLRSELGVTHNSWYRGSQEGITTVDLSRLLPWYKKFSWNILTQVEAQARLQKAAGAGKFTKMVQASKNRKLPKGAFVAMLRGLRNWIARLKPANTKPTIWSSYTSFNSYSEEETLTKTNFIREFVSEIEPRQVWDIGCNTGEFSKIALDAGAQSVIGFDFDHGALEKAFVKSQKENLNLTACFLDASNQSPNQGWAENERMGVMARRSADGLISLAFVHHMAITNNIPLDKLVEWLVDLAPNGVVEFVPKGDQMVQTLLGMREDIFENYTEPYFLHIISQRAEIVKYIQVTDSGRLLVRYKRD